MCAYFNHCRCLHKRSCDSHFYFIHPKRGLSSWYELCDNLHSVATIRQTSGGPTKHITSITVVFFIRWVKGVCDAFINTYLQLAWVTNLAPCISFKLMLNKHMWLEPMGVKRGWGTVLPHPLYYSSQQTCWTSVTWKKKVSRVLISRTLQCNPWFRNTAARFQLYN